MNTLLAPIDSGGARPIDLAGLLERVRLTGLALGYALMMVPALILAILAMVSIPLGLVTVGFAIALAVVPATAALTGLHRRLSGRLLGVPIVTSYADTTGTSVVARPIRWLRDPARWRDIGFLAFAATGGFVLTVIPPALLAAPIVHLALAAAIGGSMWLLLFLSVVVLVLWWLTTPTLLRARATVDRALLDQSRLDQLARRVEHVEGTRAEALQEVAAEMQRIERDLHDGTQARIAAVGMSVGLAEKLVRSDPDAAVRLLQEARQTNVDALDDLRSVIRGILPPVLADRGLTGAVEALGLSLPMPTTIALAVPRLPSRLESAVYFAIAELVTNTVKHAQATNAYVRGSYGDGRLTFTVGDDGRGGADPRGPGLTGVVRRLAPFDGTLQIRSPAGGPTTATIRLPWTVT